MTGADTGGNPNAWNDFVSTTKIMEATWDDERITNTAYIPTDGLSRLRQARWGPCQAQLENSKKSAQVTCDSPPQGKNNLFLIEIRDVTPQSDGDEYRVPLISIRQRGRSLTEIIQVQIKLPEPSSAHSE